MTESDLEALRAIYLDSRTESFTWLDPHAIQLSDFDKDTQGENIWVAEAEGEIVGFISVWQPENFIHHLFISPKYLNQGFGAKLLSTCLSHIGRPAQLKCVSSNLRALNFYKNRGWQEISSGVSSDGEYKLLAFNDI